MHIFLSMFFQAAKVQEEPTRIQGVVIQDTEEPKTLHA